MKELLPTITDSGEWEKKTVEVPAGSSEMEFSSKYKRKGGTKKHPNQKIHGDIDEEFSSDEEETEIASVSEIMAKRAKRLEKKKKRIGCIGTNYIQDPTKVKTKELKYAIVVMNF